MSSGFERRMLIALLPLAFSLFACDSETGTSQLPLVCAPGQGQPCTCPSAGLSTQPCLPDGSGFGACLCDAEGAPASGTVALGTSGMTSQTVPAGFAGRGVPAAGSGSFDTADAAGAGAAGRGVGGGTAGVGAGAGRGGTAGGGAANGGGTGAAGATGTPAVDTCSDTPVAGLSLSEIAVYQSVKISIMKAMQPVAAAERNADVIQGRPAVFRVHVTPGADWMPRQVAARVALADATGAPAGQFFATLVPSEASTDEDPATTFQVQVPGEALTADTRYAVTLVECAANNAAGAATGARFPADGFSELAARETGPLHVHLVPLVIGGMMPDLSPTALDTYRNRIFAVYPITSLELTVGEPLTGTGASMCALLTSVRSRRMADNAAVDVYYYGVTTGTSGGQSGCSTASASASSSGKTSAGWASSGGRLELGAATMCHELGHAHGRQHAPCNVQDPDANFPYPNANTGVWGHDNRTGKFLPPTSKDMMSYCPNDRPQAWLSDYTYKAITERVAAVNALAKRFVIFSEEPPPETTWRMLVADSAGTHWGEHPLRMRDTPEGDVLTAVVRDDKGAKLEVQVYREALEDGLSENAFLLTVPEPQANWRTIEVPGQLSPQRF